MNDKQAAEFEATQGMQFRDLHPGWLAASASTSLCSRVAIGMVLRTIATKIPEFRRARRCRKC